jgi:hypothetical protein
MNQLKRKRKNSDPDQDDDNIKLRLADLKEKAERARRNATNLLRTYIFTGNCACLILLALLFVAGSLVYFLVDSAQVQMYF